MAAQTPRDLLPMMQKLAQTAEKLSPAHIDLLRVQALKFVDEHGKVTPNLQVAFYEIEINLLQKMTVEAAAKFQDLLGDVGAKKLTKIQMPLQDNPFFLLNPTRLHDFRSSPTLPIEADIVIIGAGLTGASIAYHLMEAARLGLTVVVLDKGGVGEGASGRNGGLINPLPQNFWGFYENAPKEREKFLQMLYPGMDEKTLKERSYDQARVLFRFSLENAKLIRKIIDREKINPNYSKNGFLQRTSSAEEENTIWDDIHLARSVGVRAEYWSKEKIEQEQKSPATRAGKFFPDFGNYDPYLFVTSLFEKILESNVQLYTQTRVNDIELGPTDSSPALVHTSRGTIRARGKVIVATDGYTSKLLPDLAMVEATQSQIVDIEFVRDYLKGRTITEWNGDKYWSIVNRTRYVDKDGNAWGMLHFGDGTDRPVEDADNPKLSQEVFDKAMYDINLLFSDTIGRPPSRINTGVFAFTPDRFPVMGYVPVKGKKNKKVMAFVGSNGFGGSFCIFGGYLMARMALGTPKEVRNLKTQFAPDKYFSFERFEDPKYSAPPLSFPIQQELFPKKPVAQRCSEL